MQDDAASEARRLLRLLFVRLDEVPADADAAGLLGMRCLMPRQPVCLKRRSFDSA
jgi:hypothetical protein